MNGAVQFWEASDMWRGRSIGLVTLGAVILLGMSGVAHAQDGSEPAKTAQGADVVQPDASKAQNLKEGATSKTPGKAGQTRQAPLPKARLCTGRRGNNYYRLGQRIQSRLTGKVDIELVETRGSWEI